MDDLLAVEDLKVDIGREPHVVHALQGISFGVRRRALTGLVGESGSGKSMTALAILRALPEQGRLVGGHVWFEGQDLQQLSEAQMHQVRGQQISMVFQNARSALNPLFPVGEQIAEVYRTHKKVDRHAAWEKAVGMLDAMGIPNPAQKARDYPHQFSGGMAQRAMVAMALVCSPQLLIADEPTTGLDLTIQAQVLNVIVAEIEQLQASLLLISHDLGIIAEICTDVVVMYAGKVLESGPVGPVLRAPANPYTQALIASFQVGNDRRMSFIPGRVPDLDTLHTGCPFAPRCSRAEQRCHEEAPLLREIEPGHWVACHFA
ncbi:MAG: ABC transporter ATP-binding protein [Anaerolineae bacterium]|nr:ABC transporter ATP-binding protein [Anaerolineae bacterium]